MGLQDFRKGREGETAPLMSSGGGGGMGALTAFIDQGSEFVGKLSFKDTVRIDGRFEGEISSENTLIVGETGEIHANITSETVVISGTVEGDVTARRSVTLHKTARVTGNVETVSLIVEEGAEMHGHIKMGKAKGGNAANKSASEKVVSMHDNDGSDPA